MRIIVLLFFVLFSVSSRSEINLEMIKDTAWIEVKSPNFIVITDANKTIGEALVRDLEMFRFFVSQVLKKPIIESGPPLKVLAISNTQVFEAFDLPETWGGVFLKLQYEDFAIANIRYFSTDPDNGGWGNHILKHEYVHYATRNTTSSRFYPLWYSEGEAEYLSTFRIEGEGKASVGSMSVGGFRLLEIMNHRNKVTKIDVEDLFKTTDIEMSWRKGDIAYREAKKLERLAGEFYARSMITIHYFNSTSALKEKLNAYIDLINQGKSTDYSLKTAIQLSWRQLNKEVIRYANSKELTSWNYNFTKPELQFPEVNIRISQLTPAQIISTTVALMSKVSTYQEREITEMFSYASNEGVQDSTIALAEIEWRMKHGIELGDLIARAVKDYPNDQIIKALAASQKMERVQALLYVGHPSANEELILLRNEFREIIRTDNYNRIAYYCLGILSSLADDTDTSLLNESAIAYESARLLMNEGLRPQILNRELAVATLRQDPETLLRLKHQLATLSEGEWINSGYGRFVLEALELRKLGQSKGKVSKNIINYNDGSYYEGDISENLPNGTGSLYTFYGSSVSGIFLNGKLEGQAKFLSSNDFNYIGEFRDGNISGKGELKLPKKFDFIKESGEFVMGQEHGYQRQELANGNVLEGTHRAGSPHGSMKITLSKDTQLEREFFQGMMRYKANENLIFTGGWNDKFLPHRSGYCYLLDVNEVKRCVFEDGELIKDSLSETINE